MKQTLDIIHSIISTGRVNKKKGIGTTAIDICFVSPILDYIGSQQFVVIFIGLNVFFFFSNKFPCV